MGRALCAAALLAAAPAEASPCRLALALAIDISSSVSALEYAVQMQGIVMALRDPDIQDAIASVPGTVVQIMVYEWSGYVQQDLVVDWTPLSNVEDIAALADRLDGHRRSYNNFPTAIGRSLEYAIAEFGRLEEPCTRRIVDISGDGVNNDGPPGRSLWPALAAAGITVNALVIAGADPDPVPHYETDVITGPGSFMLVARGGFDDYPALFREKLLREVAPVMTLSDSR